MMESRVLGFAYAPSLLKYAEKLVVKGLANQIKDPDLRARLTPNYRFGCKRVLISNEYYGAIQRPNVELVTAGISKVTPSGVRTADGKHHEVDAINCGTGFRVSDYLSAITITHAHEPLVVRVNVGLCKTHGLGVAARLLGIEREPVKFPADETLRRVLPAVERGDRARARRSHRLGCS
jgi:hypothetical protein